MVSSIKITRRFSYVLVFTKRISFWLCGLFVCVCFPASLLFNLNYCQLFICFGSVYLFSATPGSGRSLAGGNGNPLQYSCLENSMDRGAWWATVHGVIKSWTQLSTHTYPHLFQKLLFFRFVKIRLS